jgi:hypothetical protein
MEYYEQSEQTGILFQNRFHHIEKSILSHYTHMEYDARERICSPTYSKPNDNDEKVLCYFFTKFIYQFSECTKCAHRCIT